jgi:hypothetical protein
METAVNPAQVFVLAVSRKGELNVDPLEGVVTVMACDGTEKAASANAAESKVFISEPRVIWRSVPSCSLAAVRTFRNKQRGEFTVGVSNEESNRNVALSFELSCARREGLKVTCV